MGQLSIRDRIPQRIREWLVDYSVPLKLFFISRSGLFLIVYFSLIFLPLNDSTGKWRAHPENLFIDGWARFDSGWYYAIAEVGYTNEEIVSVGQDTAFLPMYPILMRLFNTIIPDLQLSGIVVSNLSFLIALIVLFKLLSNRYGPEISKRTLTLISFCAFSFFFSAVYTESVFLLAVVCAFYFGERKQYFWAAICVAVAGATRAIGGLLIFPLLLLYLENIDYDWRKIRPNILVIPLGLLGTFAYVIFLSINYGNPLQFMESQAVWATAKPLTALTNSISFIYLSYRSILNGNYHAINVIHFLIFWASIILTILYHKKVGLPYTLFSIIGIAASILRPHGIGRYLVVVFPLFVAAGFLLKNRALYHLFLYINVLFLALFSIMFSHWYWVA